MGVRPGEVGAGSGSAYLAAAVTAQGVAVTTVVSLVGRPGLGPRVMATGVGPEALGRVTVGL